MGFSTHLIFGGQCEAAFQFYARTLGGTIVTMRKYRDSTTASEVPEGWRDKIVHANLVLDDTSLAGVDVPPEQYERPQGFYVLLDVADLQHAEHAFRGLAEGGSIRMALQKTFWSPAFGVLVDRFGVPWEISCARAAG